MTECTNSRFQRSVLKYFSRIAVSLVIESLVIFLFGVSTSHHGYTGTRGVVEGKPDISHDQGALPEKRYKMIFVFTNITDGIRQHKRFMLAA